MAGSGALVYVHGAGDRLAGVTEQVALIEQSLARALLDLAVVPVHWGDVHGADLRRVELSLPQLAVAPATATLGTPEQVPPPWAEHPLLPLKQLADGSVPASMTLSAAAPVHRESDGLLEICRTHIGASHETIPLANGEQLSMSDACRTAARSVASSSEYARARNSAVPDTLLVEAVGHAVAGSVGQLAARPFEMARTIEVRIAEAVMGAAAAALLAGYLGIDVGPAVKRWATDVLVPHRARLIREAGIGPADVALYQRAGGPIRQLIKDTLAQVTQTARPVVALGNSLGGVILVDALAEVESPRPDLLVTVGSQAPLLATFGALAPLGMPDSPAPFQPWLNIYDRRDLLGFVAGPVWPDQTGISDVEVDLGVGFPDSHGPTYLADAQVYVAIKQHPALAGS